MTESILVKNSLSVLFTARAISRFAEFLLVFNHFLVLSKVYITTFETFRAGAFLTILAGCGDFSGFPFLQDNVGLHEEAYFKYFYYPDFVRKDSGLIQIKKIADIN